MKEIEDLFDMDKYADKVRSGLKSIEDYDVFFSEKNLYFKSMGSQKILNYILNFDPYLFNYLKEEYQNEGLVMSAMEKDISVLSCIPKKLLERDMVLNYTFLNKKALGELSKNEYIEKDDINFVILECFRENVEFAVGKDLVDYMSNEPELLTKFIEFWATERKVETIFVRSKALENLRQNFTQLNDFFKENKNFNYFLKNYKGDYIDSVMLLLKNNKNFDAFISQYKDVEELEFLFARKKEIEKYFYYLNFRKNNEKHSIKINGGYVQEYKLLKLLEKNEPKVEGDKKIKRKV